MRTGWAERGRNAAAANICPRSRRRTRREWSQRPPFTECPTKRGTAHCSRGVRLVTEIHPKPLNCKSTPNTARATAGAHAGLLDRVPHVEEFPPGNLLRRRPQKFQLGKNQKEEDDDGDGDGKRDNREKRSREKETDERRLQAMIRQLCRRRRSSQYLFSEISFGNRSQPFPPSFPLTSRIWRKRRWYRA